MKILKKIKIGQFTYTVRFVKEEIRNDRGNLLYGQGRHYGRQILIDSNAPKIQQEETFVHEFLHCLDTVYKLSDKDLPEIVIERLGTVLHKFIIDNPNVFKK